MLAMTCKLRSLFSIEEDFDEDLLGTDWGACSSSSRPVDVAAAVSSSFLRPSSVTHREPEKNCLEETGERPAALCNGTTSSSSTQMAAGQTVAISLRQCSFSTLNNAQPNLPAQQSVANTTGPPKPSAAQDDFDDWDIDLADLDEVDCQMGQSVKSSAPSPPLATFTPTSSHKILRPLSSTTAQTLTGGGLRALSRHNLGSTSGNQIQKLPNGGLRSLSSHIYSDNQSLQKQTLPKGGLREVPQYSFSSKQAPHALSRGPFGTSTPCPPTTPVQSPCRRPLITARPHSPGIFPGLSAASPSPGSGLKRGSEQLQRQWSTPGSSSHNCSLFESVSPAPSRSTTPLSLHTPFLTNHLVQLVSASNPKKRLCSESHRARTRRFPGPAGRLPQQPQGRSLDDIVVSVPNTPAHGAVARLSSQCSSSQTDEDDFSGGAWTAMKTEMGLDERNPSCFLHSYSVVMVLRKAALKQLVKNKVPNMAVLLKKLTHTHTDAKAVFKDPTGEMQGTVHRRLLEERAGELKAGAVLLLKQVGVFSPSHRNHYLNVTANNLLRVYSPDGACFSSTQLPPFALKPMLLSSTPSPSVLREPVSRMQLLFDEEDDEGQEREGNAERSTDPQGVVDNSVSSSRSLKKPAAPQDPGWGADDLDELLGELPEDMYRI